MHQINGDGVLALQGAGGHALIHSLGTRSYVLATHCSSATCNTRDLRCRYLHRSPNQQYERRYCGYERSFPFVTHCLFLPLV